MINGRIALIGTGMEKFLPDFRRNSEETLLMDNFGGAIDSIKEAISNERPFHVLVVNTGKPCNMISRLREISSAPIIALSNRDGQLFGVERKLSGSVNFEILSCIVDNILRKLIETEKKRIEKLIPENVSIIQQESIGEFTPGYAPLCEKITYLLDGIPTEIIAFFLPHLIGTARNTICLSPSIGCRWACKKCWSGKLTEFIRFVSDQLIAITLKCKLESYIFPDIAWLDRRKFSVSLMGSGDFSDNFSACMQAMRFMHLNFGRQFSCNASTAFIKGVRMLSAWSQKNRLKPRLQVSIDSTIPRIRKMLIDSEEDPLEIIKSAEQYAAETSTINTANFVLVKGLNDTDTELENIKKSFNPSFSRIKLSRGRLPWPLVPTPKERVVKMAEALEKAGFNTEIFERGDRLRGDTIGAACGSVTHKKGRRSKK